MGDVSSFLSGLNKKFVQHTQVSKVKIDVGIDRIVDQKFDDFINEIKVELTDKLKNREAMMNDQLKENMKSRQEMFAQRYKELETELKRRFDHELDKKFQAERKKIADNLIRKNMVHLNHEKKEMINKLHDKEKKHEKFDDYRLSRKIDELRRDMQKQLSKKLAGELRKEEKELKSRLNREYQEKFNRKISVKKAELEMKKQKLEKNLIKMLK